MLVYLETIEERAEDWADRAVLSPEDRRSLHEIKQRIDSEVSRPFFRIQDLRLVDQKWSDWVDWFRPILQDYLQRLLPVLARPELRSELETTFTSGLGKDVEQLTEISPDLADTFKTSVLSGLGSDRQILEKLAGRDPSELDQELLSRREFASIGFGLAFLLLLETLASHPADVERARFLVLKLKRMAAVSWVTTRKLLAASSRS